MYSVVARRLLPGRTDDLSADLPHDFDDFGMVALGVDRVGDLGAGVAQGELGGLQAEFTPQKRGCVVPRPHASEVSNVSATA